MRSCVTAETVQPAYAVRDLMRTWACAQLPKCATIRSNWSFIVLPMHILLRRRMLLCKRPGLVSDGPLAVEVLVRQQGIALASADFIS